MKKKLFSLVLALAMTLAILPTSVLAANEDEVSFSDVPDGQWYTEAVRTIAKGGLLSGYPDGSFGPNDMLSINQFATILARACSLETYSYDGHWAYGAVKSCVDEGYILLPEDMDYGDARLDTPITRMGAISAIQVAGKLPLAQDWTYEQIPDVDGSGPYDIFILAAYCSGLTGGVDETGAFDPKSALTRAQVCQLLYNAGWTQPREPSGLSLPSVYMMVKEMDLPLGFVFGYVFTIGGDN